MNYLEHYYRLCHSRKELNRSKSDPYYYELHHITPKSFGGSDTLKNLVLLTAREHYIAHLLLYVHFKQEGGERLRKMAFALVSMSSGTNITGRITSSRQNAWIREAARDAVLGRTVEDTTNYKKPKTKKHREAIRLARLAAPPRSRGTRARMRASALNREDSHFGNNKKAQCPACNKVGQANAMRRWHFDNCKLTEEVKNAKLA